MNTDTKRLIKRLWAIINANDDMNIYDIETALRTVLIEYKKEFDIR